MSRLKEAREKAGLTQLQLAVAAGVTPQQVCKFETAEEANPTTRTARKLADALGCGIDDLFPAAVGSGSGRKSGRGRS